MPIKNMNSKNLIKILFLFLFQSILYSQIDLIQNESFYYPGKINKWQYKSIITLSLSQLPEDVIEEVNSLIYSPLINYDAIIGVPYNFYLQGSYNTNLITHHFAFGANWHYQPNNFAASIGYEIAFWFGILEDFDFSSRNVGWLHYPNISFGYSFEKFTLTVKSELVLNTYYTQFVDNIEVSTDKNTIAGYDFALYVEQPLWKNNIMSIGIKANFSRFYYPAWIAYSKSVKFRFIPEIQIGLVL